MIALQRLLEHGSVERMNLSRDRVCLVFIEQDRDRHQHLQRYLVQSFGPLEDLPVRVEIRRADAGEDTAPILDELGSMGAPDPGNLRQLGERQRPPRRVATDRRQPGQRGHRDVRAELVQPPPRHRHRQGEPSLRWDYWTVDVQGLPEDELWKAWLRLFEDLLKRVGFAHGLTFEVCPRTGLPLDLVFGTSHVRGVEVMKADMWQVDRSNGMSLRDRARRGRRRSTRAH